jgi:alkylation response protein AidB-like acyl-CoA dehydrogenase
VETPAQAAEPAELEAYRERLRAWLHANVPAWWREQNAATGFEVDESRFEDLRAWHRSLFEAGYMGVTWPREYGGQGLTVAHELVRAEELEHAGAPPTVNLLGITLCAPALLAYASHAQKARYLKKMLSAEEIWCQGYSEPGSGSDLASLQTRAVRDGEHWVVNGQKIWTSNGQQGDWIFCLVRTDPEAKKHEGIGFLLIDMHSPGVEVAPLVQITGGQDFCQVFFTDVRVPAENMVGEPTQGWRIANHVLMHERGASVEFIRYGRFLDELAEHLRQRAGKREARAARRGRAESSGARFRQRWAQLRIEYEALRQNALRALARVQAGQQPGSESSLYKLQASEFEQRLARFAVDLQGPYGQLWHESPHVVDSGIWQFRELWSRAYTIYAGTSEVQRNIISERVLGLPR